MKKDKKSLQLGMNRSTAGHRLVKDLLFEHVAKHHKCYQCGGELTRETFSVEHKVPWLDSEDPVGLFFDLNNITFSHLSCNSSAARRELAPCGTISAYNRGCRCGDCKVATADYKRERYYTPEKRRERYLRTGT